MITYQDYLAAEDVGELLLKATQGGHRNDPVLEFIIPGQLTPVIGTVKGAGNTLRLAVTVEILPEKGDLHTLR